METPEQRQARQQAHARELLPRVNALADDLNAFVREILTPGIPYQADGTDVMALSFVTKQREHLRSVQTLISADLHRDALLIARVMIEGMATLLWAYNNRPEQTDQWFWFGAVLDWRQLLKNETAGIFVDPSDRAELRSYVDLHGHRYYRDKIRNGLAAAENDGTDYDVPVDPWLNKWTPTSVESRFHAVEAERLYDTVYRETSQWLHWGPRAILRAMQLADWGIAGFTQLDWRAATLALRLACQSLIQSLEIMDHHFALGHRQRLDQFINTMHAIDAAVRTD